MEEENKINEAQVSLSSDDSETIVGQEISEEEVQEKKRRDFRIELILFFVLGILMGVAFKNEALKKITMGYDDYRMKLFSQDYNINKMQSDLIQKTVDEQAAKEDGAANEETQPVEDDSNQEPSPVEEDNQ